MTLYCIIRHQRFPPSYRDALSYDKCFGKPGDVLYGLYYDRLNELKETTHPRWEELKVSFIAKLGSWWRKIKAYILKPVVPAVSGPQTA